MNNIIFQIWTTLKINAPLSTETRWRIKELFLLLVLLQAKEKEICIIDKLEEINELSEQEQLLNWFYDNFVLQHQLTFENEVQEKTISLETSAEILALIERYQTAANPLQWTNFGSQIYFDRYLSQKIDLLYQIGGLANILAPGETFNSSTRVMQETQDVCDRVCRWVKSNVGAIVDYVNIYEPFIYKYKQFTYQRSDALKKIGVRSGLLADEILENEEEISEVNTKAVINWLDDNYGIKLILPEKYQPKIVNDLATNDRRMFAKTVLLVAPIFLLIPVSILFYDHLQRELFPSPEEVLLKRRLAVEKLLPPKPAQ